MIHVGVNLLWLVPGVVGGSEVYVSRLLEGLAERGPGDNLRVTVFALRSYATTHPEVAAHFPVVSLGLSGRAKSLRVAAESTWLPRQVRHHGVDLVHHAGGTVPRRVPPPALVTIHDLQPLLFPENFGPVKRRFSRVVVPRSVRAAELVLAPSDHTRRTIVELLDVDRDRVRVVPHGVRTVDPATQADATTEQRLRERYRIEGPYFLYPAITYPHKNHLVLVRAFARLVAARSEPVTLVLAGGSARMEPEITAAVRDAALGERVRRVGRIPRSDLDALFDRAAGLVFPSRFEGFGIPVLEAMSRGCPVVVAEDTALPEVVGDAGILLPPDDPDAWTAAMGHLLDDPDDAARLARAGRSRAADFSWDRAAAALADAYKSASP